MNIIDVVLIIVIGLAVINAWKKGFVDAMVDLTVWLGSFVLAIIISNLMIDALQSYGVKTFWIRPLFFVAALVIFSRLIFVLCDRLSAKIPLETHDHWANKISGIFPGLITGVIYASLLSFFLVSYPLGNITQRATDSRFAAVLLEPSAWPGKIITRLASNIGHNITSELTVHPNGSETVPLPFKTDTFRKRPDLEVRMLYLINKERTTRGLKKMFSDRKLADVASKHCADMLNRGYFSHYTPEGFGPFDRMRKANVPFSIAGENLALASTLQSAHNGLMESPVHKANILHKSFGRVGISILDAGVHGIIVTQNFRN